MTRQHRRLALLLLPALLVAACGGGATGMTLPVSSAPATGSPAPSPLPSAPPSGTPAPTPVASPGPTPVADASPSAPMATATAAPSPTPAGGPSVADFWALVERGVREAGRLEVDIAGPADGTLRFEHDASATVIEGVIGFVCLGGRAYDGQSGFTRVPGTWTCGAPALVAGFRNIGQPIDAWNVTVPADDARRETLTVDGASWTWRYRSSSPYYGGTVTASVTVEHSSGRITAARREDPIGVTRYTFRYGADFAPIAVPRN